MTTLTEKKGAGEFIVSEAPGTLSRKTISLKSGLLYSVGAVLGMVLAATAVAAGGNTGDGAMGAITIGPKAEAGDYLLKITGTGPGVAAAGTSGALVGTGNGTITASPATGAGCKVGTYKAIFVEPATDLGTFIVEDPDGITIGSGTVGVAFTTHLTFTIADGSTDFTAGSYFPIAVAAANSGTFSLRTPSGVYLPEGRVGVAYASLHLNFTLADGAADFAADDSMTITVAPSQSGGLDVYGEFDPAATDGRQIAAGIQYAEVDATSAAKPGVAHVRECEVATEDLEWKSGLSADQKADALAQLAARNVIAR